MTQIEHDKYGEDGFCWECGDPVEEIDTIYGFPRFIPGTICGPCGSDKADKLRGEGE